MAGGSNAHDMNEEEGVNKEGENHVNDCETSVFQERGNEGDEEGEEEDEEVEDEEDADDDGYILRFHGGMDPMKFAEVDASGAEPYKQFERLKCQVLAERKRKGTDEIKEIMGAVVTKRRSRQPKKRGRKKGSRSNMSPEVMEKLGEANLHYAFGQFDEAINVLKEVVLLAPNLPDSYHTLALCAMQLEIKKGTELLLIAAHLTPKDAFLWKRLVHWSMEGVESLYNIARAYHHVGFVTLAAAYYEKVLAMHTKDYPIPKLPNEERSPEIKNAGQCSLSREAAINLHLIYKSSGALDLTRQVLKDYCTP